MDHPLNEIIIEHEESIQLQTKVIFDRVGIQTKKMPESLQDSGNDKFDSVDEFGTGANTNSTIPNPPNSYKDYGTVVENFGYFSFPRSISSDPRYKGARLKYRKVLHTILENAAFRKTIHSIGLIVIDIEIGQFCVSVRGLMDLCNEGVKYKAELVDKNIVERASHFWQRCGFVRQEVRHGKILLTVTIQEFYKKEKLESETESETEARQKRDSKETIQTIETLNISIVAAAPSEKNKEVFSSRKRKKVEPAPLVERDKGVFTSDIAHQKLIVEKKSEQIVKEIYSAMAVWKDQNGIEGGDDYKTALRWSLTPKSRSRSYNKPSQTKYNHDTSPSHPSKSISFAEDV
jgi:hypothetical protein